MNADTPYTHGERLYEAGADHAEFVTLNGVGHTRPHFDFGGGLRDRSIQWFERFLVRGESFAK